MPTTGDETRVIEQITSVLRDGDIILFALACDGTLWRRNVARGNEWKSIKNIPQYAIDSGKLASYCSDEE